MLREERRKALAYYSELIDDRIEGGMTESEAVAACGDVAQVAGQLLDDARTRGALRSRPRPVSIVLLALGSPLWAALILAAVAVVAALYITVWAILVSLFAVLASLLLAGVAGIVSCLILLGHNVATAFMVLGLGFCCAGIGLALFWPLMKCAGLFARLTAAAARGIWTRSFGKGGAVC